MYDSHVCACTHTDTLIHIVYVYMTHIMGTREMAQD